MIRTINLHSQVEKLLMDNNKLKNKILTMHCKIIFLNRKIKEYESILAGYDINSTSSDE